MKTKIEQYTPEQQHFLRKLYSVLMRYSDHNEQLILIDSMAQSMVDTASIFATFTDYELINLQALVDQCRRWAIYHYG